MLFRQIAALAMFGIGVAGASAQEPSTHLGVLTCTSGESVDGRGADLQVVKMTCGFKPAGGAGEERYVGTLHKGEASGQTTGGKRVLVWAVIGPAGGRMAPGALAQRYAVATHQEGGPARALVGQANAAIALQSESADGTGGVTQVELKLSATPA